MTSSFDGIPKITKEQVDRLCESSEKGYLVVPLGEDDLLVRDLYNMARMLNRRTGVCLSPGQDETLIAASCYGPAGFEQLLKTAEGLAMKIVIRCPKSGYLVGRAKNRRAPGIAKNLMVLRTGPDRRARRCRSRTRPRTKCTG